MSQPDANARILAALPTITPDALRHSRTEWRPTNIMRMVLIHEGNELIESARNRLESCTLDELSNIQGEIVALRKFQAVINSQGPQ